MVDSSKPPHYALVAYLRGPVAEFVEGLRAEFHPARAHLRAHVTVLPPRDLAGEEQAAATHIRSLTQRFAAFVIEFAGVESFAPATPTVFIRVSRFAHRFRDMHVALNSGPLQCDEPWTYIPHLTIVKTDDLASAREALTTVRARWAKFRGPRTATVDALTFVRQGEEDCWTDVERIALKGK